MPTKNIVIISGATATGKTKTSIDIARHFKERHFEIINFDSLLFYKELNIGTAKPSKEEIAEIQHHLVNISSISNELNANEFIELAKVKIDELHDKSIIPILVGGSTFYLRALIKGMYDSVTISDEIRSESESLLKERGITFFLEYLKEHDPESLKILHENDHYRITRAYEHYRMTGSPISEEKKKSDKNQPYDFSINQYPDWNIIHLNMHLEKELHWNLMKERAAKMIDSGLIEEVKNLLESRFTGTEKPLQSIGYKETIDYLNGKISSKDELLEKIYIATRRLAKSQKTFLKKVTPKKDFNPLEETTHLLDYISQRLV